MRIIQLLTITSVLAVLACGGGSEEADGPGDPCLGERFESAVDAAAWARTISPISTYHYLADPAGGEVELRLLDAKERLLGTMRVSQRFGDPDLVDGSMEATLDPDGAAPLRLSTLGQDVTWEGYQVRARLRDLEGEVEILATFGSTACWASELEGEAPACAAGLPLSHEAYVLPSCGLIQDQLRLEGRPPVLARLSYEVPAGERAAPSVGGFLLGLDGERWILQVLGPSGLREPSEVEQWLVETGAEALISSDRAKLLTTAFLDRSWWRTLEQHFASCQELPAPEAETDSLSTGLGTIRQGLCPGQHRNSDWAKPNRDSPPSSGARGAGLWGDPHLTTLDGLAYDFQGAGEYVLVESTQGDPLVVQGRFAPGPERPELVACENVSYAHAIAAAIGEHRLMVRSRPSWAVYLDGALLEEPAQLDALPEGSSIRLDERELALEWPDGSVMTVTGRAKDDTLRLDIALAEERRGQVRGLLGNFNGDPADDRALPDGTVLPPPLSFEDLHRLLGPAWLVTTENSLFVYDLGDDLESHRQDGFPTGPARLEDLPASLREEAEATCRSGEVTDPQRLAACILDTICWGDDAFVDDAASVPAPAAAESSSGDVFATGDIRKIPPPAEVAPWEEEVDRCSVRPSPTISLFLERESFELEAEVVVDAGAPGRYESAEDLGDETLSKGMPVRSYLLYRGKLPRGSLPLAGRVRFDTKILGLAIESPTSSDPQLGAEGVPYRLDAFEPFGWEGNAFGLSSDMRELEVHWGGAEASRVRIITEAVEE